MFIISPPDVHPGIRVQPPGSTNFIIAKDFQSAQTKDPSRSW